MSAARRLFVAALIAGLFALRLATAPASAGPNLHQPDYCQHFDDTGEVISVPWSETGCQGDRDVFRAKIQGHYNNPGWYPPLTCVVRSHYYDWDAPACAHARNQYQNHQIRPQMFGSRAAPAQPVPSNPTSGVPDDSAVRDAPSAGTAPYGPVAPPAPIARAEAPRAPGNPAMGAANPQAGLQPNVPPIILDGCKIEYSGGLVFGQTGFLDVEFSNESNVTADLVRIRVQLLDGVTNIRDVGTFTPGISIKHRVRNEAGQVMVFPLFGGKKNAPRCTIVMVHFIDGTTWVSRAFAREQGDAR
jgi:hypothetical protein